MQPAPTDVLGYLRVPGLELLIKVYWTCGDHSHALVFLQWCNKRSHKRLTHVVAARDPLLVLS